MIVRGSRCILHRLAYRFCRISEVTENQEWTLENAREYSFLDRQKLKVEFGAEDEKILKKIQNMKEWANFKKKIIR